MKKIYLLFVTIILAGAISTAKAQDSFTDLLKASPADATKLIDAYGKPIFQGFGVGMNSGWANTAKTKGLFHFEVRVTATAAITPNSSRTFDVTQIGLSNNVRLDPSSQSPIAQTIGGDKNISGPTLGLYDNSSTKIGDLTLPSGQLPFHAVPTPQVQLTVGLIKSTDLTIRFIPNIKPGGDVGSVNMIGFGLKHDLTQYIFGPAKKLVPFDLSVLFAYSRLNLNYHFDIQPESGETGPSADFSTQRTEAHFNSFLAEALISKKLLFFTPFLAVGYNTASTNLSALGNYPVTTGPNSYSVFTDPVNIKETTVSGFRADVGFQLNLGIRIFASASLAKYKSVNAGLGFGF